MDDGLDLFGIPKALSEVSDSSTKLAVYEDPNKKAKRIALRVINKNSING
ncbi:MAG: hypothetical protein INF56_08065 [Roseomonas sp.]|nr:hypothetical protein [Roseomonas sp.]